MLTWTYIIAIGIDGKHNFKRFTIYTLTKIQKSEYVRYIFKSGCVLFKMIL